MQIFNDQDFLLLYNMNESHLWRHRAQVFEAIEILKNKNTETQCTIVDQFKHYAEVKMQNKIALEKKKSIRES